MKKFIYRIFLCLSFLFLLCFPEKTMSAASYGLTLWFDTLVPTLFPVMLLSNLLIRTNLAANLTAPVSKPLGKILGISPYGAYAMLAGFTCGYPIGVKVLSDLRSHHLISSEEAIYLASFCNNVSPAFVINYLVSQHLHSDVHCIPTLIILYGAPLLYCLFSNHRFRENSPLVSIAENKASFTAPNFAMIDACIIDGIQNITKLGGYIILFSVFTAMTDLFPLALAIPKACLTGILEITTGIHKVTALNLPFSMNYLFLIAITAFGGLCSAAQSDAMLEKIGISMGKYLRSRLAITAISLIMAICYTF